MTEKPSPESPTPERDGEGKRSPIDKFTDLARRLVSVTPGEVAEQQEAYYAEEDRKRRPRLTSN